MFDQPDYRDLTDCMVVLPMVVVVVVQKGRGINTSNEEAAVRG